MKHFYKIIFMLLFCNLSYSQNPDHKRSMHWYFGNKCGLDFSSGQPVADTSGQMVVNKQSATMSDTLGNLLFYTDGETVWNRLNQIMQNGTGLGVGHNAVPWDAAVIIPKPDNNNIYYIFTVDGYASTNQHGFGYSIVDMAQDGGNGAVIQKNIQLLTPNREQLAATKDASGCGYWIATHEHSNANFRAYHITSAGLDTTPVISTLGTDYSVPQQIYSLNGGFHLIFSPNGKKAATWIFGGNFLFTNLFDKLEMFDFDNNTGIFSNAFQIPVDSTESGICFSPDSKKFYVESGEYKLHIHQFDLSSNDSTTIHNSRTVVYDNPYLNIAEDMAIGYNGKIYLGVEYPLIDSLSVINNPNAPGMSCGVQHYAIGLKGRIPNQDLTTFVSNFLIDDTASICSSAGVEENKSENDAILIYPNPANQFVYIKSGTPSIQIKIIDMMGFVIFEDDNFKNKSSIICQSYPNGIYIMQLRTKEHQLISSKLIINH